MVRFHHAVRCKDHLSELECYDLDKWIGMQFALGEKLLVVENALQCLLAYLDDDMSQDLSIALDSKADAALTTERKLADKKKPGFPPSTEKEKVQDQKNHASDKPNDHCCWFWTNGYKCKYKDGNGTCKRAHLHDKCGVPLSGGDFCQVAGRATDHANH
jgi:hypothetical protein